MTDADNGINPLHFGCDLADIRIRIHAETGNPDSNPGCLVVEALLLKFKGSDAFGVGGGICCLV